MKGSGVCTEGKVEDACDRQHLVQSSTPQSPLCFDLSIRGAHHTEPLPNKSEHAIRLLPEKRGIQQL
jgi:hypothetical protein